jgi:hypothetical protein
MKRDEIEKHLSNIDVTLARQATILEEHIRRTGVAEKRLDLLQEQIEPLKTHIDMSVGAVKLIGVVSVLSGIVVAAMALIKSSF